jgi:hypothetical protein
MASFARHDPPEADDWLPFWQDWLRSRALRARLRSCQSGRWLRLLGFATPDDRAGRHVYRWLTLWEDASITSEHGCDHVDLQAIVSAFHAPWHHEAMMTNGTASMPTWLMTSDPEAVPSRARSPGRSVVRIAKEFHGENTPGYIVAHDRAKANDARFFWIFSDDRRANDRRPGGATSVGMRWRGRPPDAAGRDGTSGERPGTGTFPRSPGGPDSRSGFPA